MYHAFEMLTVSILKNPLGSLACLLKGVLSSWFTGMGIDGPGFGGMNRMGGGTCGEVLCIKFFL